VDIRSETEFAAEEAEHGYEEEEAQGRCAAILSNGRRCPNASLPGSRYCGLESHQALANITSDKIVDLNDRGAAADSTAGSGNASAGQGPADAPAAGAAPVEAAPANLQPEAAQAGEVAPAEVAPAGAQPAGVPPAEVAPAGASPAEVAPAEVASMADGEERPREQSSPAAAEERAT
jgi:N utilization substance protein A